MKQNKQVSSKKPNKQYMHPYVVRAVASRYCELTDEDEHCPELYFLMTANEEILDLTDDPSDGGDEHCVAASEADLIFISEFQKNWPEATPRFWELQLYRNYAKAKLQLFRIQHDNKEECALHRSRKIAAIRDAR